MSGTTIQSVLRALDIIEVLAASSTPVRLQDIAVKTGINTSTCHHLLNSLAVRDFAIKHTKPKGYGLGPRFVQLARQNRRGFDLAGAAKAHLEALMRETGHSVCLATIENGNLQLQSVHNHPGAAADERWQGDFARAAHATSVGKAILAWLPENQIARIIATHDLTRFTDYTICTLGDLAENLRQVRRHGFALEDREHRDSVVAIACALRDSSGGVVGSIGCLLNSNAAKTETLQSVRRATMMAAEKVSSSIP